MDSEKRILKRDELAPLEKAVSDTLDEWLIRLHGIVSSWQNPELFIEWLEKRSYTVVEKAENAALRERVKELEAENTELRVSYKRQLEESITLRKILA